MKGINKQYNNKNSGIQFTLVNKDMLKVVQFDNLLDIFVIYIFKYFLIKQRNLEVMYLKMLLWKQLKRN